MKECKRFVLRFRSDGDIPIRVCHAETYEDYFKAVYCEVCHSYTCVHCDSAWSMEKIRAFVFHGGGGD